MTSPTYSFAEVTAAYQPAASGHHDAAPARQLGGRQHAGSSAQAACFRMHLDRYGGLITPAVQAAIMATSHGQRHSMLRAIAARLVQARWSDADVHALVVPSAIAAWPDVAEVELRSRLNSLLNWVRGQEAAKADEAPTTVAMTRLAAAFRARQGSAR